MKIKIWEVRTEKGISLDALSKLTGISKGALSNYENEKRYPTIDYLERIAKALEVNIEELYESDFQ